MRKNLMNEKSRTRSASRREARSKQRRAATRRPRVEALEGRALLAAVLVNDSGDSGPGTFRNAIEEANDDSSVRVIRFARNLEPIQISSTVEYTGGQKLTILGRDAVVEPSAAATDEFDLLVSSGNADLAIRDLTLQGGSLDGLSVPISADATGAVRVSLHGVTVSGNGLYGVHVDDQSSESPASIHFSMTRTNILGNGIKEGADDFDGVRIDEGGDGDAFTTIRSSTVENNFADGVEVDEKGSGSVIMRVSNSTFNFNGEQPQKPEDLEDGLDIDEAGPGGIDALVIHSQANGNDDEGIDFDEEGEGDLVARLIGVQANGNLDENIKLSEDADAEPPDPEDFFVEDEETGDEVFDQEAFDEAIAGINQEAGGDLIAHLIAVQANGSRDGDGIRFEEFGFGDLIANLILVEADGNDDEGIQVSEGSELYTDSAIDPSVDLSDQNQGDLRMRVVASRVTNNGDKGIQAEQFDAGEDVGTLKIRATVFENNDDDDVDTDGVVVDIV